MTKAYVVQKSRKMDFSSLDRWGEPIFLFGRGFYPDDVVENKKYVNALCDAKLADFNLYTDYLVPVGCTTTSIMVGAWLINHGYNGFRVLKWDNRYGEYYPIHVGE